MLDGGIFVGAETRQRDLNYQAIDPANNQALAARYSAANTTDVTEACELAALAYEVTRAMVHGGPFPATSHSRTTSVGTLAMMRFLRPACYQDIPDALLPPSLQANNPWSVPRHVDA